MGTTNRAINESSSGRIAAPVDPVESFAEVARAEVLALPAQHLPGLPLPTRFILQGLGISTAIVWTSESSPACREGIVFDAEELRALVSGVQAERLWPSDLKGFCLRKLHDPSFRVNELLALGGAQPACDRLWSLGRVLRWFELELQRIELVGADRAVVSSRAAAA